MLTTWIQGLRRSREADPALFERLMDNSYRQAYAMAVRLAGNATDGEDLLQETYVRAYRFFHRYDEALPFTSWLFRIMTNVHIDSLRRKARLKTVSLEGSGTDGQTTWEMVDQDARADRNLFDNALGESVELGLKAMTPEFRVAVLLADVEGMSYEEIAEVMSTSVGTVRSRIHRGRKQLRQYLEQKGEVAVN